MMCETDTIQQWTKQVCNSAFLAGNEMVMLVASTNGHNCQHYGSAGGEQFIRKYNGLKTRFANFCRGLHEKQAKQEQCQAKSVSVDCPVVSPVTSTCIMKELPVDVTPDDCNTSVLIAMETNTDMARSVTAADDTFPLNDTEELTVAVNGKETHTISTCTTSNQATKTKNEAYSEKMHNLRPKPEPSWKGYKPKPSKPVKKRDPDDTDIGWVPPDKRQYNRTCSAKRPGSIKTKHSACVVENHDTCKTLEDMPESYCFLCERDYKSSGKLKTHMKYHNNARPVACDICDMQFKTSGDNQKHLYRLVRKAGKGFGCKTCHKHFKTEHLVGIHQLVPCEPAELRNIQEIQSQNSPCVCDACGLSVPNAGALERHKLNKHSDAKVFKCSLCTKQYKNRPGLLWHVTQQHTDVYTHHCTYTDCPGAFKTERALKKHVKTIHKSPVRSQCDICGSVFTSLHYLKKHRLALHIQKVKEHVCDVCGLDFHFQDRLKYHMMIHSKDRQYRCSKCPDRFKTNAYLKKHVRRKHAENRQRGFVCNVCGVAFYHEGSLYLHRRTSHDHHLFKCDFCSINPFKSSVQLKKHLAKLHAEEAYDKYNNNPRAKIKLCRCETCNEIVATARELTRHKANKHMTEKPYACRQCDQKYSFKEYLDQHEKTHKALTKYHCLLCHKRFIVLSGILRHLKMMHNVDCEDGDMSYIGCGERMELLERGTAVTAPQDVTLNTLAKECESDTKTLLTINGDDLVTVENVENGQRVATVEVIQEIGNDHHARQFTSSTGIILQAVERSNSIELQEVHGVDIYEDYEGQLSQLATGTVESDDLTQKHIPSLFPGNDTELVAHHIQS